MSVSEEILKPSNVTRVTLKCGCQINDRGEWVMGDECSKRNCGECRTISQLHPFTKKRLADMLFKLE